MPDLFDNLEWNNAVDRLRVKGEEFTRVYDLIINSEDIASTNDALYSDYESIKFKGNAIKATIEKVTLLIDEAFNASSNIIGKDNTINMIENNHYMGGLGFIPLIPIAAITAAIAAITYWVNDAMQYLSKVEQVKNLINRNVPPEKAYDIVHGQQFTLKKYLPWIVGGVVTIMVAPKIIRLARG